MGTGNFRGVTWADDWANQVSPGVPGKKPVLKDKTDDNTTVILPQLNSGTDRIYFTDEYLDFKGVFARVEAQVRSLMQDAVQHGIVVDVTHEAPHYRIESMGNTDFLILDAGHEYVLSDDLLNRYANRIILDVGEEENISQIDRTLICSNGLNPGVPSIERYLTKGEVKKLETKEAADGLSLVFLYPNAENVTAERGTIFGHVVAPRAYVETGMAYNGCVLARTVKMTSEGHMWPYSSDRPLKPEPVPNNLFMQLGHKTLRGAELTEGRFRFALQEAQESLEPSGRWLPVPDGKSFIGLNAQSGSIGFAVSLPDASDEIPAERDLHYILSEIPGDEVNITYDTSRYLVTVRIAISAEGEPTLQEGYPQYSRLNDDGYVDESAASPDGTFVNVERKDIEVRPVFEKTVDGRDPTGEQRFVFTLTARDGAPMPTDEQGAPRASMTATNTGRYIEFDAITYTAEMLGDAASKEFRYTVSETGAAEGTSSDDFDFDPEERVVVVTLSKEGDGGLCVKTEYEGATTFANTTKTVPTGVDLSLAKIVQGEADLETGTLFTFHVRLSDDQGRPFAAERLRSYVTSSVSDPAVEVDVQQSVDGVAYLVVRLPKDVCWTLKSLPQGTRYAIEETDLPEGYTLVGLSSSADAIDAVAGPLRGALEASTEVIATNRFDRDDVTVTLPETGGRTMTTPVLLGLCMIALTIAVFPSAVRRR